MQIIKILLASTYVLKQELMQKCKLTKRQLEYSMDKINDWVKSQHLQPIRFNGDQVSVDSETYAFLLKMLNTKKKTVIANYFLSNQERVDFLYLMIFSHSGYLSVEHFISGLQVSKSTVFKDINALKALLTDYGIALEYNRKSGYYLSGEEKTIRHYMLCIVLRYFSEETNRRFLDFFIESNHMISFPEMLEAIVELSKSVQLTFVENRMIEFTYIYIFLRERLKDDSTFIPIALANYHEIKDTPEYTFAKQLLKHSDIEKEEAVLYICSCLLGFSTGVKEAHSKKQLEILQLVERMLDRFEALSGIVVENHQFVCSQIYIHFQPTYYRLLFNLPVINPLKEEIRRKYNSLFLLVKASLKTISDHLNMPIPDDEIAFLTLHFASIIDNFEQKYHRKKTAIIICPNGIGSSMLLYSQLKAIFPEIFFLEPIDYLKLDDVLDQVDVIFTTSTEGHYFNVKKPFFFVSPIMTDIDAMRLKQEVYYKLHQIAYHYPNYTHVFNIIKRYVPEADLEAAEDELKQSFIETPIVDKPSKEKLTLTDLIQPDYLQLDVLAKNKWEAVEKAAQPLLQSGTITEAYIGKMMESLALDSSYLVIAPNIAMPHAKSEYGVNKPCMSLTVLAEPVIFGNEKNDPVNYIFCLAAKDKESHLTAMSSFVQLISSEEFISTLATAHSTEEVLQYIKNFEATLELY